MGGLCYYGWLQNRPVLSTQSQVDFSLVSQGNMERSFCLSPAKIPLEKCEKAMLLRDDDSLSFSSALYSSSTLAHAAAQSFKSQGRSSFVIGKATLVVDSSSSPFWDEEASMMVQKVMDPTGELNQQSQRPFPQSAQIPGSEWVDLDQHLDKRSAKPWLCRSYALKSGQAQICMAEFENPGQCLAWLKQMNQPQILGPDSSSGTWSSPDQSESAYSSCHEEQGLSITGNLDPLYLQNWGQECRERQRIFKNWNH